MIHAMISYEMVEGWHVLVAILPLIASIMRVTRTTEDIAPMRVVRFDTHGRAFRRVRVVDAIETRERTAMTYSAPAPAPVVAPTPTLEYHTHCAHCKRLIQSENDTLLESRTRTHESICTANPANRSISEPAPLKDPHYTLCDDGSAILACEVCGDPLTMQETLGARMRYLGGKSASVHDRQRTQWIPDSAKVRVCRKWIRRPVSTQVWDDYEKAWTEVILVKSTPAIETVDAACKTCRDKYFEEILACNLAEKRTGKARTAFIDLTQ